MDLETTQKITDLQRRLDTQELPERPTDLISSFMAFTGLRGFWPMSAFSAIGDAFDQSGNGRTLTYNGNPTYNYDGLVPYIDLDGTGDFLSRADEAGFDIIGTETYVASAVRGLTLGGWFWTDSIAAGIKGLITKHDGATIAGSAYEINISTATPTCVVHAAASHGASSSITVTTGTWNFILGRYTPSTEVAIFVNGTKDTNVAGIPASINNSAAPFNIGAFNSTTLLLDGRASLCFLCAAALSDTIIDAAFQATRAAFGV